MTGSKRQRELARRRAERQAERRAAAARQRRQRNIVTASGVGVLLIVLGVFVLTRGDDKKAGTAAPPTDTASASASASETADAKPVACGAKEPQAIKPQSFKTAPPMTIDKTKKYVATIKTSCGTVVVDLLADKAPTTVNSFNFLAGKKYFDGSRCHRMLSGADSVLQCGDPTALGSGSPGYDLKDENLPKGDAGGNTVYKAGTLAMANAGANTGGSQFFFVIKDSPFPANYAVFGTVSKGMDVLEKILALGVDDPGGDGAPNQRVFLESFTVAPAK